MRSKQQQIAGWGNTNAQTCELFRPERVDDIAALIKKSSTPLLPRGLGRSYGDAAVSKGRVVLSQKLDKFLSFDAKKGRLRVQAGVTITDVLENFLHRGWILPVMPGTRHVTMGGCLASDIHGKDHRAGTFGNWVKSFVIHTGDGQRLHCSGRENTDLFHATIGGMGLTGFIEELTIQMEPIRSSRVEVQCQPFDNIGECLDLFEEHDDEHAFVAAWLDVLGPQTRGWIQVADFCEDHHFTPCHPEQGVGLIGNIFDKLALFIPAGFLNKNTLRLFNWLTYRSVGPGWKKKMELPDFFFPLDSKPGWNRLYGKAGFFQFQCVLPQKKARDTLCAMLTLVQRRGQGSFFTTLKKFSSHKAAGLLTFPMHGMTLAMDFPNTPQSIALIEELNAMAAKAGGRVYLTKDALLGEQQFHTMYPNWQEFIEIKKKYDPQARFQSMLYKRLMKQSATRKRKKAA